MEGLFKVRVEVAGIGWSHFSFESRRCLLLEFIERLCQAFGNTYSYLACNHETGVIAISNNDMHKKLGRKGKGETFYFDPDLYRSFAKVHE